MNKVAAESGANPKRGGAWRGPARRWLLLLAAGWAFACLLGPGALPQRLIRMMVLGDRTSLPTLTELDPFLRQAVPEGNLLLRFRGFVDAAPPPAGEMSGFDTASLIYFRTVYVLYPRRVYTGPEERRIIRGTEFINEPFDPDAAWLRERGVRSILTFTCPERGKIYQEVTPVRGE